ncbi:hypothetical protein I6J54_20535 [Phocaeicola dorei]|nr:hypothetical protein [Phocaeicola dorei]MBM6492256.1 hypothetical protein [Phocaeicola dorei]MBM6492707.1 hypothetical protein [Phocaeicola dorei]MBM6493582.1 hypothetical protein [Phocaeicola dorei]MBM6494393.1 hypothetical protein [Phocaeicola dorei]
MWNAPCHLQEIAPQLPSEQKTKEAQPQKVKEKMPVEHVFGFIKKPVHS